MKPEDEAAQLEPAAAEDAAPSAEPMPETSELGGEGLLELVLAAADERQKHEDTLPPKVDGVVIGTIAAVEPDGAVCVSYLGARDVLARVMTAVTPADTGRDAALLFEGGNPEKPVVMGLLFRPQTRHGALGKVDGERLVFSAEKEIVLECGDASITLTRAGKILIKGNYVLSRSKGTNRIQGGSVQIN